MSRLFSDFEKSHLSQFFVDWQSINQWIFHKCVYSKYENFIPVYLIKVSAEKGLMKFESELNLKFDFS